MLSLRRIFLQPDIPPEYNTNFIHLYFDIGWFGVLSGSSLNFLNVYAARLGASGLQIGLLAATGAIISLVVAIPAGLWLEKQKIRKAVFWTSVVYRLGFLFWIPLPWLLSNQGQIWALVAISLAMGIPLTALTVGFNTLFAEAVPASWRAHVAGLRNVVLSITFILSSLFSGYLLDHLPFPQGYQVVFGIGFIGAAMSSLHLYFVRPLKVSEYSRAGEPADTAERILRPGWRAAARADVWQTSFRNILLVFLGFHLTQYLAIPIYPLALVRQIHLNDQQIGFGTALFYLTVLLGSTQLARIVRRLGHHKATSFGLMSLGLYPILLALSSTPLHYYVSSVIGGFTWALTGGAYANYLLERIPTGDRPAHLAWYNLILNAAILIGSLAGPYLASHIGLGTALILIGFLRLISGLFMLYWG